MKSFWKSDEALALLHALSKTHHSEHDRCCPWVMGTPSLKVALLRLVRDDASVPDLMATRAEPCVCGGIIQVTDIRAQHPNLISKHVIEFKVREHQQSYVHRSWVTASLERWQNQ